MSQTVQAILDLEYNPNFLRRGIHYDVNRGIFMKVKNLVYSSPEAEIRLEILLRILGKILEYAFCINSSYNLRPS